MKKNLTTILLFFIFTTAFCQMAHKNFRIRTITAGINMSGLSDTTAIIEAITWLKEARKRYQDAGYEVQTIRISTQHFYLWLGDHSYQEAIPYLQKIDEIVQGEHLPLSIGQLLPSNTYHPEIAHWAFDVVAQTKNINFSLPISSNKQGIMPNSIKAAAEVTMAISKIKEGNFRFTAAANCPAGIPFFPAAYHQGPHSFAIGIEYPNLLKKIFEETGWEDARPQLKLEIEKEFRPVEQIATELSQSSGWPYDGIDSSPAPGPDASIGEAIESLTGHPFGEASTLSACALITDVIKNLDLKTCGYSGLMLPIIEDKVLALRAKENRFTLQELLLYSSVCGTGLDVVPLPGNTSQTTLERIYQDVATLSMKYTHKALSARLFLLPDKKVGDAVEFEHPYLTPSTIMKAE